MVRAAALLVLAGCAARPPTSTVAAMTAAKKASAPDPAFFQECSTLVDVPEAKAPAWESLVLATDVQTWASGACEALDRSLTPLTEASSLSRQALRDECDEKSQALAPPVRSSCRAVCGARRWLEGRALARERLTHVLEWVRDDFDFFFERIEQCPATKAHANQLGDSQVRAVLACAGKAAPAGVDLRFQYVTESVSWSEGRSTLTSARPVEAQWLQAVDADPNLPWRAMVTRCRKDGALLRVLVRY